MKYFFCGLTCLDLIPTLFQYSLILQYEILKKLVTLMNGATMSEMLAQTLSIQIKSFVFLQCKEKSKHKLS